MDGIDINYGWNKCNLFVDLLTKIWDDNSIMSEYYKFFQNKKCEYFPCHKGIPEEDFNCLFCYCPLYTLGKSCGGNCEFLENGVKSCMKCGFPHQRSNYDKVISRFQEIIAVMAASDKGDDASWNVNLPHNCPPMTGKIFAAVFIFLRLIFHI